jgi:hypothetical protein
MKLYRKLELACPQKLVQLSGSKSARSRGASGAMTAPFLSSSVDSYAGISTVMLDPLPGSDCTVRLPPSN